MNWIKNILIVTIISIVTLGVIEGGARVFYRSNLNTYNLATFMESKPKAFDSTDDFDIVLQSFDGTCSTPALLHSNGVSIYEADFSCGGMTYKNGKRITLPTVSKWDKTIHFFGGSTAWGTGSTDSHTIPSFLQSALADKGVRVLNYGVSSYVAAQQNATLLAHKDDIRKGDIVIYYDGGNDFWNGVMLGNFDGSMIGYNVENRYQVYLYIIKNWLSQNVMLYQIASDLRHEHNHSKQKQCSVDYKSASNRVEDAANHYKAKILQAEKISHSLGATFYHFYQPTLSDSVDLTPYEKTLLSHNPCWEIASRLKPLYDNAVLNNGGMDIDISNMLIGKDLFFDYVHVSSPANHMIAQRMLHDIDLNDKTD